MISEVDEIFVLWDRIFAVVTFKADHGSVAACEIQLAQNGVTLTASGKDWLLLEGNDPAAPRPPLFLAQGTRSQNAAATGEEQYLVHFPNQDATAQLSQHFAFQVRISDEQGSAEQGVLKATRITPQRLATAGLGNALSDAFGRAGRAEIAAMLRSKMHVRVPEAFGPFHLEQAIAAGTGAVVDGWVANLAVRNVHVLTGDFSALVLNSTLALRPRPDVHEHLHQAGALQSASNAHGFTAVIPVPADASELELFFVEYAASEDQVTFYGPMRTKVRQDNSDAFQLVRQSFGEIQSLPQELVSQVYRPLLALPKAEARAKKFHFGPSRAPDREPITSIIIPFYGDAFFLNCVHHLQRVLDEGFELILVVDDARIWPDIYNSLVSRSRTITVPTILLQNAENYGFGRANNLGYMVASGDVVFLMNSDIMVIDPAPLREAANVIRTRRAVGEPELIVGFSLLYEDNTIQHIGMDFPRSSLVGDMHLADHPMKGLPFARYRGDPIRHVPAVTAALMGLSSDLYQTLAGFDPMYERGDFEDADLCLRAERLGVDIQVFVRPGLYHLERQSIPRMGNGDLRQMVTYMNCVAFNQRWQARLARQPAGAVSKPTPRIQVKKRVGARS